MEPNGQKNNFVIFINTTDGHFLIPLHTKEHNFELNDID